MSPPERGPDSAPKTVLFAHPAPDLYGSDRMLLESVSAAVSAGMRAVVTMPSDGPLSDLLTAAGARVVSCPTLVLRKALLSPRAVPELVRATLVGVRSGAALLRVRRPDVLVVNTLTIPLWPVLGRFFGIPVIVHVHEAEHEAALPVRLALTTPLLAAQAVIVNSRATAAVISEPGTRSVLGRLQRRLGDRLRDRIQLVYNGVAGPDPNQLVIAAPTRPDPLRIVYVGRLSPRKGVAVAIRALAELHQLGHPASLELAGDVFSGYEWFAGQLHELVDSLGLTGYVRFAGFVAPVWAAYARADVAIVPSLTTEPFGNVSVEAQLAGRPVVVARTQGLVETVRDGITGVVVAPDDPAALAMALARLAADWPAAVAMARAARQDALHRFGPARYRAQVAGLLGQLSAGPPARSTEFPSGRASQ